MNIKFNYTPVCDKIKEYHASPAKERCLVGGWGSGKTHAMCAEVIMLCMEYPNNIAAICRQTFGELDRSTRLVFESIIPPEIVERPYSIVDHMIHLVNGSKVMFFPLDKTIKIHSITAGVIAIDEASEVSEEMALFLSPGRLRLGTIPRRCFLVASNPTSTDHWLYKWFSDNKKVDRKVWQLSTYDNKDNLPEDYLKDLERSLPPDLYERYVLGRWGYAAFGERVYPGFGTGIHIGLARYNSDLPIIRGWDFGYYRPAVVFLQVHPNGWIRVLSEHLGNRKEIETFAEDVIHIGNSLYPGSVFEDYGDPAGSARAAGGQSSSSAISILKEKAGIEIRCRKSTIKDGMDLIRRKFSQNIDGQPAIIINKETCPILIEGFSGGYACKKDSNGAVLKDEPRSDGYFEHLQDAFRYAMINKFAIDMKIFDGRKKGLPEYRATFPGTSW